ncbi:hypothetical protein [Paenibacillus cucumis (ex Kampfer et al. 2016)]|nr:MULTISPECIES: hypothetical protein [Paenibacillus]
MLIRFYIRVVTSQSIRVRQRYFYDFAKVEIMQMNPLGQVIWK